MFLVFTALDAVGNQILKIIPFMLGQPLSSFLIIIVEGTSFKFEVTNFFLVYLRWTAQGCVIFKSFETAFPENTGVFDIKFGEVWRY